jgi:hypothetical protein
LSRIRLATIVCSLSLAACVAPEQADDTDLVLDETEQAATTSFTNDQPAYLFFVEKGLSPAQAAGIVGNLDQESGVDPASVQYGGGPGRGIAQWSVGGRWDTSNNDNVLDYATTKSENAHSLNLQLEFVWYELKTIGYGYSSLKATTNVTDATIAFMDKYEICGTCASSQRLTYAKAVLAAYGAKPPYGGTLVSTSWPDATMPPVKLACGATLDATVKLKNAGAVKWTTATKLGTTMPRDRKSMFAGSEWASPDRPAALAAAVAAGAEGTFTFTFHAPTGDACVPGTYHEHFGVVQDGVTWFSDQYEGGPADDQIDAVIELVPSDGSTGGGGGGDGANGDVGGGCTTGGGASGFGVLLALAGVLRARRRR